MGISDWLSRLGSEVQRAGRKEQFAFRDLHRDSIKLRTPRGLLIKELSELDTESHLHTEKIMEETKRASMENRQAHIVIQEYIAELKRMGVDVVVIGQFVATKLKEVIATDNKLARAVPGITEYRERAVIEFDKFEELMNKIGHAFQHEGGVASPYGLGTEYIAMMESALRQPYFPLRGIYSDSAQMLRDKRKLKRANNHLKVALRDHLLDLLKGSEQNIEELVGDMIMQLRHICLDILALFHVLIVAINKIVTYDTAIAGQLQKYEKQMAEISKNKPQLLRQLQETRELAVKVGGAMLSVSREVTLATS